MSMHFRDLAEQAAADGAITPEEILSLRRAGWSDGRIEPEEAEAIFVINDRLSERPAEWADFFVEALSEFAVNGTQPRGYVNAAQADWLIARMDHDGHLDGMAELELLVKVLEKATDVPARLKDYALVQIEQAVLTGEGPTRRGGALDAGCISEAEVALLRRIVFAQAGDRPAAVSRHEAEMLFRIKDATLGAANAAGWQQLFVQGVGNYLSGFSSYAPLSSERAAELDGFMNQSAASIGGFLGRMARAPIGGGFIGAFGRRQTGERDAQVAAAAAVTSDEKLWLQDRIDADDQIDPLEKALLNFLAEEAGA